MRDADRMEAPEVRTRAVVLIVAGILVLLSLIAFGFAPLFADRIGKTFSVSTSFPAPEVIANERDQRLALEASQRRALNGAGGRIPIGRAMKATAARGPHAFDPVGRQP